MEWAFLHPQLWPALLVGALPVVIHLISKRRARELHFAAMEFVLRSQKRSARRIQLRQWLLLLVRTLLLLALVLAVMGPVRRQPEAAAASGTAMRHVFAVDLSGSMLAVVDGEPRWKRAVELARKAAGNLPAEEPVAIVACPAAPQAIIEPPTFDRAAVENALGQMKGTLDNGDLPSCLARARIALGTQGGPGRITVFTDAAHHAWPQKTPIDLAGLQLSVVRPDKEAPVNHLVRALDVKPAPEAGNNALGIEFDVEAFGSPLPAGVEASLTLDGVVTARMHVPTDGAGPWRRRFTHALSSAGVHALGVTLADDALSLDNTLSLPVRAPREVQVLVIDGDPQTVAWRDEVFYLERALSAPPASGGTLRLKVVVQPPTPQELEGVDVVMLCNVRSLPAPTVQALDRHVRRGGGLFISGGDRVDVDFYNKQLGTLLPQPLRGEKSRAELQDRGESAQALTFSQVAVEHPIFAPFSGQRPEGLTRAQTQTILLLEPSSRAEREVLLRFSNEAPALVEKKVGNGRVLLLTTTVDRDWSDLAIRPGFLPLVQQSVLYLADALTDGRPRHSRLGEARQIPVRRGVSRVVVQAPSGASHEVVVRPEDSVVVLPPSTELGMHQVLMAPEGGELTDVPQERFSVWPTGAEADLTPLTDDELALRMPQGAQLLTGGTGGPPPQRPLWPALLVLLQLFLVAEAVLARRG